MFTLKFTTGNAAFHDSDMPEYDKEVTVHETIRILKKVIEQLEYGYEERSIADFNGNRIGEWKLK